LSFEPILVPQAPSKARLFQGSVDDWHAEQREIARAEGYAAAIQDAALQLDAATAQLDKDRKQALQELPAFALRFAQEVARHLIRTTIQAKGHDMEGMVRDALARSGVGRGACVVHVCPDDFVKLQGITLRRGTEIQSDSALPAGTVHVATPQGLLVRDIDTCVRAAAEQIYKTMSGHKTPLPVVKPMPPALPEPIAIATTEKPTVDSQPQPNLVAPELISPDMDEETLLNLTKDEHTAVGGEAPPVDRNDADDSDLETNDDA
jgi:hypothetical protein